MDEAQKYVKDFFNKQNSLNIIQIAELIAELSEKFVFVKAHDVEFFINQAETQPTLEMSVEETITLLKTLQQRHIQESLAFLEKENFLNRSNSGSLIDMNSKSTISKYLSSSPLDSQKFDGSFLKPFTENKHSYWESSGNKRSNLMSLSIKSIGEEKENNIEILQKVKSLMREKKDLSRQLSEKEETYLEYIKKQESTIEELQKSNRNLQEELSKIKKDNLEFSFSLSAAETFERANREKIAKLEHDLQESRKRINELEIGGISNNTYHSNERTLQAKENIEEISRLKKELTKAKQEVSEKKKHNHSKDAENQIFRGIDSKWFDIILLSNKLRDLNIVKLLKGFQQKSIEMISEYKKIQHSKILSNLENEKYYEIICAYKLYNSKLKEKVSFLKRKNDQRIDLNLNDNTKRTATVPLDVTSNNTNDVKRNRPVDFRMIVFLVWFFWLLGILVPLCGMISSFPAVNFDFQSIY